MNEETRVEPTLEELAVYDWVATPTGMYLHQLASFDDPAKAEYDWGGPGRTTCRRHSAWLSIPGMFSRMGGRRCARCCDLAGFPRGVGSPKNDPDLRPLVGLERSDPSAEQSISRVSPEDQ